ncbi:MAG: DUF4293 domain-containing protein [Bacteroidales bacterium]|nr:DUF4293 domain-containing protein [Bacteroidales bacterium]
MIQRIQSLFLFLVVILGILMFFSPLASFFSEMHNLKLYVYKLENMVPGSEIQFGFTTILPLLLFNIAITLLSGYTIFLYKNRILQIKLIRFCMLLNMFIIVGVFFLYPRLIETRVEGETEFGFSAYLPLVSLLFLYLANRYILKDEKLVRSIDRLR